MLFTDPWFAVLVLATMALFYAPPMRRLQTPILILASLIFYGLNQWQYLFLLAGSIVINTLTSHAIYFATSLRKARAYASIGLIINLAILGFFKYAKLIGHSLPPEWIAQGGPAHILMMVALPIGISFFTFEGISLVVDTFKARDEGSFFGTQVRSSWHHLEHTTLFVSFFPHLVAGPILKAHDFYPQIKPKNFLDIDWEFCFRRLVVGFFLKMVVADGLKEHTFWIAWPHFVSLPSMELILMLLAFSMQIFADFAGYSLIAVGVAALFGYRLMENFNFPYIARSFSEFWRRWHISLSTWLRDYLYFPLGGNRKGKFRTYFNLFTVMFLGGLWHGAAWSYAVWGSVHGLALAIERLVTPDRKTDPAGESIVVKILRTLLVFSVVTAAWLLFKLPEFSHVVEYCKAIGNNWNRPMRFSHAYNLVILGLPVVIYHAAYLLKTEKTRPLALALRPIAYGLMLFLIVTNAGSPGEFIYFQF